MSDILIAVLILLPAVFIIYLLVAAYLMLEELENEVEFLRKQLDTDVFDLRVRVGHVEDDIKWKL